MDTAAAITQVLRYFRCTGTAGEDLFSIEPLGTGDVCLVRGTQSDRQDLQAARLYTLLYPSGFRVDYLAGANNRRDTVLMVSIPPSTTATALLQRIGIQAPDA